MIQMTALARVRGDDHPVIILGLDMQRALVLHQDGSLSTPRLEDVVFNVVETAVRFDQLEQQNTYGATESAKFLSDHYE